MLDVDARALRIYTDAGCDIEEPPGPVALAQALGLRVVTRLGARGARLVRGRREIMVSSRLAPDALAWAVAHEVAEWHLGPPLGDDLERERACDAIAAALLLPYAVFRSVLASSPSVPDSLPDISRAFVVPEGVVALRIGEVTGRPLALVTPRNIHLRGSEWRWPDEAGLRQIASGARSAPLIRWPLSDGRRRTLLLSL